MKKFLTTWIAVALLLVAASPADAAFRLRVESGTTTGPGVVVTDGASADLSGASGAITVAAGGGPFTITLTTGLRTPTMIAPGFYEAIDLNNISINSGGAGTLRLILEGTDFSKGPDGPMPLALQVGGVLTAPPGSTVTF